MVFWQVEFRLVMFRPFVGEIITAKLKESDSYGLRCMSKRLLLDYGLIKIFCLCYCIFLRQNLGTGVIIFISDT